MQQAPAADGGGFQGLIQNPKVQIGIFVTAGIAVLCAIAYFVFSPGSTAMAPITPMHPANSPVAAADVAPGTGASARPAAMPMPGTIPGAAARATPGAATTAPKEGAADAKLPPGVPVRKDPFDLTKDLKDVVASIPEVQPPAWIAPPQDLYMGELHKPRPDVTGIADGDENPGPPIPPMRVAGVVYGEKVSATMQLGNEFIQVVPGQSIPASNPLYKVERIEQDKVLLTRSWDLNGKHGVQKIEVGLVAAPQAAAPAFRGGFPGGFGGNRPGGNGPGGNGPRND